MFVYDDDGWHTVAFLQIYQLDIVPKGKCYELSHASLLKSDELLFVYVCQSKSQENFWFTDAFIKKHDYFKLLFIITANFHFALQPNPLWSQ